MTFALVVIALCLLTIIFWLWAIHNRLADIATVIDNGVDAYVAKNSLIRKVFTGGIRRQDPPGGTIHG